MARVKAKPLFERRQLRALARWLGTIKVDESLPFDYIVATLARVMMDDNQSYDDDKFMREVYYAEHPRFGLNPNGAVEHILGVLPSDSTQPE